ncbi:hypothetical protein HELRODRAFT_108638 [Helobdella robusta]|uniref:Transporter n=1 Tax=Helobdella robusta TaxID=6412 RepID=T1EEL2_HELRO|nr:hypothetical protein HELRODRAFT_108638 [Helobdella robusta]ESN90551.1 hypothetical protein HELRODRAFT_108638 [Helobdella robusta]
MERGAWGGKLEFLLTCIGSAVGLGNVWRFPYLLFESGGGAFLIPFVLMLFLIGIPLFYLEITWGQFASLGPLAIFRSIPIFKGIGFGMIFTNITVALYYNVIITWCLYYFFASLTSQLPWEYCNNAWNTKYCATSEQFKNNISNTEGDFIEWNGINMSKSELVTPSEEYFYRKVLQLSPGLEKSGTIVWQLALCLFLAWTLVFLVLIKGIASLGKVVYVTSTFPYLLLTLMLVRGVTLPGASIGIQFYMLPDFSRLADSKKVWSNAAIQIFYALSTCTGALIAMSSYNNFKNNTLRDALIVPIVNVLTSIYAGFVIFSVLGYMADMQGKKVEDVAADGPGLVFVVYPEGLSTMPAAPVWSVLFFLMMMMLGFSSMFGMVECFFVAFMDEFPMLLRKSKERTYLFRGVGILIMYLISLPMVTNGGFYLFSLVDSFTGGFPLLIIGLFELLTLMFVYGYKNFEEDMSMMMGDKPVMFKFFRVTWCIISPFVILLSVIATAVSYKKPTLFNGTYVFPAFGEAIGWLIVTFCLMFIPLYIIYYMRKDLYKLYKQGIQSEPSWGPAKAEDRTGRYKVSRYSRTSYIQKNMTIVVSQRSINSNTTYNVHDLEAGDKDLGSRDEGVNNVAYNYDVDNETTFQANSTYSYLSGSKNDSNKRKQHKNEVNGLDRVDEQPNTTNVEMNFQSKNHVDKF